MSLDFAAFDVETANYDRGSICAVGWAVVRAGEIVDAGSSLCRPPDAVYWFDPFISSIHGITDRDVENKPRFDEIVPKLIARFADLPVIAHNAAFDIGALCGAYTHCGLSWPTLSYGCTLAWSRRLLGLPSNRLPIVCSYLGISLSRHHDAGDDARAAAEIAIALAARERANTVGELLDATWTRLGRLQPGRWNGCGLRGAASQSLPQANLDADPANPFYGETVVFTGGLSCMHRKDAWRYVADAGGTPDKDVTRRTTLVVLGDGFRGANTFEDLITTEKALKAWLYHKRGQRIEFWSEVDFVEALTGANIACKRTAGTPAPTSVAATGVKQPSTTQQLSAARPPAARRPPVAQPSVARPPAARRPQRLLATSGAADRDMETLICFDCGARWQRPRSRAPRPGQCPDCRRKD